MTGSNGRDRASTDRLYRSSAPGRSALTEPAGRRCSDEVCAATSQPAGSADSGSGTSRRLCRDGKRRERLYHHCEPSSHGLADARRLHFRSVTAAFSRSFANLAGAHANFQTYACFDYRGEWQGGGDPQSCGNALNDRRGKDSYATSDEFPNSARGFLDRLPKSQHRSAAFASRSATPPCQ